LAARVELEKAKTAMPTAIVIHRAVRLADLLTLSVWPGGLAKGELQHLRHVQWNAA
jgi:hypothetical protein